MDRATKNFLLAGVVVALLLAGVVSFYASAAPDGLERVAAENGIDRTEKDHPLAGSPLGDYGVKGVANERLSGGLAGVIGVIVTLVAGTGVFWFARRRGTPEGSATARSSGAAGASE